MEAVLKGENGKLYEIYRIYHFIEYLIDNDYALKYQESRLEEMREEKLACILEKDSLRWKKALKYLKRARHIAKNESHCYSRQVAAVIVGQDGIDIRTGYNGPPIGFPHCERRHPERKKECPRRYLAQKEGREFKSGENLHLCPASHAERNAIYFASRTGVCVKRGIMYLDDGLPCKDCAIAIVQSGISEVVCLSFKEYSKVEYSMIESSIQVLDIFYHGKVTICLFKERNLLD